MRKFCLMVLLLWGSISMVFCSLWLGGGTLENPWQITNVEDLAKLSQSVNSGVNYAGVYFQQTANIDLNIEPYNTGLGWPPIGKTWYDVELETYYYYYFAGIYDGNGKTISALFINNPSESNQGLFGFISEATIKNLGIINPHINGTYCVGALLGTDSYEAVTASVIDNCYSTYTDAMEPDNYNITGVFSTGGLIGSISKANVTNCYSSCNVQSESYAGGLIGSCSKDIPDPFSIINSHSSGNVKCLNTGAGGLIGDFYYNAESCYSTGNVEGKQSSGGFIGSSGVGGTVTKCYSTGDVAGESMIGGFVGYTNSAIDQCYSTGNVSASVECLGGFVGCNGIYMDDYEMHINNSYCSGNVNGGSASKVGGFVGRNETSINNCYSSSATTGTNSPAGFANEMDESFGSFSLCYWDYTKSPLSSIGATAKTTYELMNLPLSTLFPETTVWERNGESYPTLIDNSEQTLPVTLSSFSAICTASNTVSIAWTTQSESNMIGYHILRTDDDNLTNANRITDQIIHAVNVSTEHNYSFTDQTTEQNTEYNYWLESIEMNGTIQYYGPIRVKTGETADTPPAIPLVTQLKSAYPNPFNPITMICFDMAQQERVVIDIFNAKGQKIKTLYDQVVNPGHHQVLWDGTDSNSRIMSSGIYFYSMSAGKYKEIHKMLMVK